MPTYKVSKRLPAQSGSERLSEVQFDGMSELAIFMMLIGIIIGMWYAFLIGSFWAIVLMTIICLVGCARCLKKTWRIIREVRQRRQGIDGERNVADCLARLDSTKYHVFHDIIGNASGSDFNIDHVVVSEKGVFCLETKTTSVPDGTKVYFNGRGIRIGDKPPIDFPLTQVDRNAKWLGGKLDSMTGRQFKIRKAVLYPARFVEMTNDFKGDIWVLNPSAFVTLLEKERSVMPIEEVNLIADRLKILSDVPTPEVTAKSKRRTS